MTLNSSSVNKLNISPRVQSDGEKKKQKTTAWKMSHRRQQSQPPVSKALDLFLCCYYPSPQQSLICHPPFHNSPRKDFKLKSLFKIPRTHPSPHTPSPGDSPQTPKKSKISAPEDQIRYFIVNSGCIIMYFIDLFRGIKVGAGGG